MIFFKRFCSNRLFVGFLTLAFSVLSFASSAPAMFIPSPYEAGGTSHRAADLEKIQKFLESKLVQHKLSQLGPTRSLARSMRWTRAGIAAPLGSLCSFSWRLSCSSSWS